MNDPFSDYFAVNESLGDPNKTLDEVICECPQPKEGRGGRKLIVAFDGTSNRFGLKNTNVVELYARIEKNDNQRTYYNSGIGTYSKPSWRSWAYWKTVAENKIDLAVAWNFEKIVMGGYRWLSENYQEGDRIFLFGFSRGAYQVRVLAGMIETVGLIFPGNAEQIPFAYELYADSSPEMGKIVHEESKKPSKIGKYLPKTDSRWAKRMLNKLRKHAYDPSEMAGRFKETFSRPDVKIHFVGVWDTVSSVGIGRTKALPLVHSNQHICFFRHALALDECRVKFLPEYIHEGESIPPVRRDYNQEEVNATSPWQYNKGKPETPGHRRVKEVWFAGTHSDVGGGIKINKTLDIGDVPCLWMANEALTAGLNLKPSRVEWDWKKLEEDTPSKSLTWIWWLAECIPFKQLTYESPKGTTRAIHKGQGRVIKPGQKIHASVAFKSKSYRPKAMFSNEGEISWDNIIGHGRRDDIYWANPLTQVLEMDLFDHSKAAFLIEQLRRGVDKENTLEQLSWIANSEEGAAAILSTDEEGQILLSLLRDSAAPQLQFISAVVFYRVATYHWDKKEDLWTTSLPAVLNEVLTHFGNNKAKAVVLGILSRVYISEEMPDLVHNIQDHLLTPESMDWISEGLKSINNITQGCFVEGLEWLAVNGQNRQALLQAHFINSLAQTLQCSSGNMQQSCVNGLTALANDEDTRVAILQTDTINLLVDMLQSSDGNVQGRGAIALSALAKHDNTRAAMLQTDTIKFLVQILQSSNWKVQDSGVYALSAFANHNDAHAAMLQTNAIKLLVPILQRENWRVQKSGVDALSTFAKHDKLRAVIRQTDAIKLLVQLLQSNNQIVQNSSAYALSAFAEHDDTHAALMQTDTLKSLVVIFQNEHGGEQMPALSKVSHKDFYPAMLQVDAIRSLIEQLVTHLRRGQGV